MSVAIKALFPNTRKYVQNDSFVRESYNFYSKINLQRQITKKTNVHCFRGSSSNDFAFFLVIFHYDIFLIHFALLFTTDDNTRACARVFSPQLGFSTRHGVSLLNNNYLQQCVTLKTISRHKIVTDLRNSDPHTIQ